MESIELVLAMLLAVLISGYLVRALPFSVPLPIVQVALGGLIAGVLHQGVVLQPSVFFLLFLPPLLFLDGWRIPKNGLLRDRAAILQLALGLVVFTVIGAGHLIHWLIPSMPLAVSFAVAAIISPTDPVAVSSIAARAPVPKRLMRVLEGESLLNDASGLVCFQFAVAATLTNTFSAGAATLTFLWVAFAGLASGVIFTLAVAFAQQALSRRFGEESGSPILISLLIPFGAYLLAERLQGSGILAAVAAGITMSYVELAGRIMATTRLQRTAVWNTIQFTLNGIMFVLLGEQLPGILRNAVAAMRAGGHHDPWWLVIYAVSATAGLALLRIVWVWVSLRVNLYRRRQLITGERRPGWRLILATTLCGVRGAVTLAGALTLPLLMPDGSGFPARSLAIFVAAAVIVLSLVAASIGLPRLLRGLDVPYESSDKQEEDHARSLAARAAIESVRRTQHEIQQRTDATSAGLCTDAASRVIATYQRRLRDGAADSSSADQLREADAIERALHLAGLQGEREEVLELARSRQISDEISRRIVREIDLLESLYH
ncbi:MAG: Na+/H+ antiporter [Gammaproteobacteria bacterium]|nr:Na+/H+ antiporter [Gammaproteobacteria bacterium]